MDKIINELENEIKKLSDISETVTFNNAGQSLQLMGDKIDNFLILHKAKLNAILEDVKILNGKTRKDFDERKCEYNILTMSCELHHNILGGCANCSHFN